MRGSWPPTAADSRSMHLLSAAYRLGQTVWIVPVVRYTEDPRLEFCRQVLVGRAHPARDVKGVYKKRLWRGAMRQRVGQDSMGCSGVPERVNHEDLAAVQDKTWQRAEGLWLAVPEGNAEAHGAQRGGGRRWPRQPLRSIRRAQRYRPVEKNQPQTRIGGRLDRKSTRLNSSH